MDSVRTKRNKDVVLEPITLDGYGRCANDTDNVGSDVMITVEDVTGEINITMIASTERFWQ